MDEIYVHDLDGSFETAPVVVEFGAQASLPSRCMGLEFWGAMQAAAPGVAVPGLTASREGAGLSRAAM